MSSTRVSVLVPLNASGKDVGTTLETLTGFLQTTGFGFDVRAVEDLRTGVAECEGDIIVVSDGNLPYAVSAIGDAVALIESGAAEVVFGSERTGSDWRQFLLRWLLVPILPDATLELKAFSADAVRLLLAEAKLTDATRDLELAYLANKYGFRVERLTVHVGTAQRPAFSILSAIGAAISIRMTDRRNGYRAPRRCPVCFSSEVWSWGQIPGNLIRVCHRCKCRYLNHFAVVEESVPVRRVLRAYPPNESSADPLDETAHARTAREKTAERRLAALRRQVASRARVLEIGVRDGSFGVAAAREYEYVGIDSASATARTARGRGLEVYCSTLAGFVNTGPAFDAVTLFYVLEDMPDPHDALARIKDLLKPGGVLLFTAFDTEGLLYLLSERRRAAQNFRSHVILYSRSALIEMLERSGFEIVTVGPEFEYRDHKFLRHRIASRWPSLAPLAQAFLKMLPDPLLVSSGSIRIVAKRRAGAPVNVRAIRSVEPTHAR